MNTSLPSQSLLSTAYQACLGETLAQCPLIFKRWCSALADILHERSMGSVASYEKQVLQDSAAALKAHQSVIVEGFALELTKAMGEATQASAAQKAEGAPHSFSSLRFDQLELMGDDQVQETLDSARLQQFLLLAADTGLAEFSARLSTAQGFKIVQADKNPLRPEVFSQALLALLRRLPVSNDARSRWLTYGAQLLGKELQALYVMLDGLLEKQGVALAPYGVLASADCGAVQSYFEQGHSVHPAQRGYPEYANDGALPDELVEAPGTLDANGSDRSNRSDGPLNSSRGQLLTLDHLHRLLVGDYDDSFQGPHAAGQFSGHVAAQPDFSHTVPAAMDLLGELRAQGLARLDGDNKARVMPPLPIALLREQLKAEAKTLGQALGIEVVGLMMEQLVSDERLLAPVRQSIAEAEPAFLRLGTTDPRFFSDKKHPARQLLDAMTAKSLAYPSEDSPGFDQFMQDIQDVLAVLKEGYSHDAQDFAALLAGFEEKQSHQTPESSQAQHAAVQALLRAEQRNLLAEKIAQEIRMRPDFISGNRAVASFLTGPWAHVMANERMLGEHGGFGSAKAVYSLTLGDLLWSLNIDQASRQRKRLVKIIPGMLNSIRQGLLSIDYPLEQSKAFYDALMMVHEAAIKPAPDQPGAGLAGAGFDSYHTLEKTFDSKALASDNANEPWLAPQEAQQSGFMEDWKSGTTDFQVTVPGQSPPMPDVQAGHEGTATHETTGLSPEGPGGQTEQAGPESRVGLLLGAWVELLSEERWLRAQLTWISPHNTLFMFTSGGMRSHSMTSRMLHQLLAADRLKIVSDQGVLEGALDNVARTAMRNSVDIALDI